MPKHPRAESGAVIANQRRDPSAVARLLRGAGVLTLVRLLAIILAFSAVPFLLQDLGTQQFALYALGSSIFLYLSALDFGFSDSAMLRAGPLLSSGRRGAAVVTCLRAMTGYITLTAAVLAVGAASWTELTGLLNVPTPLRQGAVPLFAASTIFWLAQKLAAVALLPAALHGYTATSQVLPAAVMAVQPAAAVAALSVGRPDLTTVAWSILASSALLIAPSFALFAVFSIRRWRASSAPLAQSVSKPSRWFGLHIQVNGIADLCNFTVDRLIVAAVLGLPSVTSLELSTRPAAVVRVVALTAAPVIFPLLVRHGVRTPTGRQLVNVGLRAQALLVTMTGTLLVATADPLLTLWVGGVDSATVWTCRLLTVAYAVHSLTALFTTRQKAEGRYGAAAAFSLVTAAVHLTLAVTLVRQAGTIAIGLAVFLAFVPLSIIYVSRVTGPVGSGEQGPSVLIKSLLCMSGSGLAGAALPQLLADGVAGLVLSAVAAGGLATLLAWWTGLIRREDAGLLKQHLTTLHAD